jgi:hypothetical protein
MAPMSDGGSAGAGRAPSGGRHARAQDLIERRAAGEELGEYDSRILEAHLTACSACREWAEERQGSATVVAGQEEPARATVSSVEAVTPSETGGKKHLGSDKDAMGQDKRREVVGHSWGPSKGRQLLYYGLAVAFVIVLYIGGKMAIDELDKAPAHSPDQAPWSQPNAPQTPPQRFQ